MRWALRRCRICVRWRVYRATQTGEAHTKQMLSNGWKMSQVWMKDDAMDEILMEEVADEDEEDDDNDVNRDELEEQSLAFMFSM